MKKQIPYLVLLHCLSTNLFSQTDTSNYDKLESGIVSLDGKQGVTLSSKAGEFTFKPYILVQTRYDYNYYDNEGLALAEQDNVLNSGFSIPYAVIGFAGKAFDKISFNITLNPAVNNGALLNQAWFDIHVSNKANFRVGKFKTPFSQSLLVRLGQTLFPSVPQSLLTRVNIPFSLNSVNPYILNGFDLGAQVYGDITPSVGYQFGIFNGTGITKNTASSSLSDEYGIPSLLYATRFTFTPYGKMPLDQGTPSAINRHKVLLAVNTSYNVEANQESSNDLRSGVEFAYLHNKLYLNVEAYLLQMDFVERQQLSEDFLFIGTYAQVGYFIGNKTQLTARCEYFDRNATKEKGQLIIPALGLNYFIVEHNLKIQAYYQGLMAVGHADKFEAYDDDNGMTDHKLAIQFQFAF